MHHCPIFKRLIMKRKKMILTSKESGAAQIIRQKTKVFLTWTLLFLNKWQVRIGRVQKGRRTIAALLFNQLTIVSLNFLFIGRRPIQRGLPLRIKSRRFNNKKPPKEKKHNSFKTKIYASKTTYQL